VAKRQQDIQDGDIRNRLLDWIPSRDYSGRQNALQSEIQIGTGQWFLNTANFHTWMHHKGAILFCPGSPGVGKTHIASLVVNYLQRLHPFVTTPALAYIYFEYTHQLTRLTFLGSLLEQLARMLQALPTALMTLYEHNTKLRLQPFVGELQVLLREVISKFGRCFIVVDGLDECTDDEGMRTFLLETLTELRQSSCVNILAMTRDVQRIRDHFSAENCLEIEVEAPDHDIGIYLDDRIPRVIPRLADDLGLCQKIKTEIIAAAGGMYVICSLYLITSI
jgi:hypothetical protein